MKCVRELLLAGADPSIKTHWGTATEIAAKQGYTEIAALLRQNERQFTCFFTGVDLTQGDQKIYVVEYLCNTGQNSDFDSAMTIIVSEGQENQSIKDSCKDYDGLVKASYADVICGPAPWPARSLPPHARALFYYTSGSG